MATRGSNKAKARSKNGKSTAEQAMLPFRSHGGRRKGAGRKPKGPQALVSHAQRAPLAARFPVHVTCKLRGGLPRLRNRGEYAVLRTAFAAGCDRFGFRLAHYAVLNDHLHFVVEAAGQRELARGLQGLLVRIAKRLNKLWGRRGGVFADRYHSRILTSPREVRNALVYVFGNARKHAVEGRMLAVPQAIDTFTSAPWFDGFREHFTVRGMDTIVRPLADARSWLLRVGWRRHGLLSVNDLPATA